MLIDYDLPRDIAWIGSAAARARTLELVPSNPLPAFGALTTRRRKLPVRFVMSDHAIANELVLHRNSSSR